MKGKGILINKFTYLFRDNICIFQRLEDMYYNKRSAGKKNTTKSVSNKI